jgi:hypothetical protein
MTFDVVGRVTDPGSGEPLSGLRINPPDAAETDTDGRFMIRIDGAPGDGPPDPVVPVPIPAPLPGPLPRPLPPVAPPPPDPTVSELGENLAASVASIQQELAHYPMSNVGYLVDELAIELPAGYWIDALGQLRVRLEGGDTSGRLRLQVKPVLGDPPPRSVTAPQPLAALGTLPPDALERLAALRVFSVDDLLRVSRNAAGLRGLEQLGVPDVEAVLGRAELIALPSLPAPVAESLAAVGVDGPRAFLDGDPAQLAGALTDRLGQPVKPDDVRAWQERSRPLIAIEMPGAKEAATDA